MIVLDEDAVGKALPMGECIDAMERAFASVAHGAFVQPLRLIAWQPDGRGGIASMPAYLDGILGAKLITVFPQNRSAGLESHQGIVALHESQNGRLLAILHAGAMTAIRTAAVSGVATRLLANPDAAELALLGSGAQAASHLLAMREVRDIRRVRIWSRTPQNARVFAERETSAELPVIAHDTIEETLEGADIVCTLTAATAPIVHANWVAKGAHINSVGASVPGFRELDSSVVHEARVYVDMRDTALRESDDLRELPPTRVVGELSEMVTGTCPLRTDRGEITLFKSVGMAIEDLAAAQFVYERAIQRGLGIQVDF
jgi:ornithine cyclodeaminase/alanine dehydrogenase-like protein (mu-crystallin family)